MTDNGRLPDEQLFADGMSAVDQVTPFHADQLKVRFPRKQPYVRIIGGGSAFECRVPGERPEGILVVSEAAVEVFSPAHATHAQSGL
jgi:hypothetical protein